jgi:cytochrome o ubiquinol oxidase subunit 3
MHETSPDPHHDTYSKTVFGFWVYLITDFMLFATLFAAYAVLQRSTFGGPSGKELFDLPLAFFQTIVLLTSSFTCGLAGATVHRKNRNWTLILFGITFLLGIVFMGIGLTEFTHLLSTGNSWQRSAFLSAFYTLVGMHGIHIVVALFFFPILLIPVFRKGLTSTAIRRLTCLRMFWQFLNLIWVFIFTIVFMGGSA